ncbi:hypothetical protein K7X08_021649 [Anisodus acutangulus]|uniref:Uncharacterized protein n=1 Tax=Anisodus acutangulus TaxID=402998 RepID=A0A9Q1RDJ9_9SOLA|nr:hypothetical protein K7X08_021649 [Anisodus acutangulus]
MNALKKKLKKLMMDIQGLKKTMMAESEKIGYGQGDEESLSIAIQLSCGAEELKRISQIPFSVKTVTK